MKKLLLSLLMIIAGITVFAQLPLQFENKKGVSLKQMTYAKPDKDPTPEGIGINPASSAPVREWDEQQIGVTWYDLQTNHMLGNRLMYYPEDGSVAAIWTYGINASSFGDRGTGYNLYDGNAWLPAPTARIEDERTGWPTYAPWGEQGEMVMAHLNVGLKMSQRPTRGTGPWTYTFVEGPPTASELAWPRIMTNGEDHLSLHMLVNSYSEYQGQDLALMYYRSDNGGETWLDEALVIDGLGADYYTQIYSDSYAWANPVGDTIAFVVASAWNDLIIMKSFDNGENWDRIVVWEHPYPMFDWDVTVTDTFYAVDNSASIVLDKDGKAHVTFGIARVLHDAPGDTYWVIEGVDGIGYWNEDMEPFSDDINALSPPQYEIEGSEMIEDVNYIGWSQDVDGDGKVTLLDDIFSYTTCGLSTQPSMSVDEFGNIFVVWASTTETFTNGEYNMKHIWLRSYSPIYGWLEFNDLTDDLIHYFDECILPQMTWTPGEDIHVVYFTDITPGIAVNSEHSYQEYKVMHTKVPKDLLIPTGIPETPEKEFLSVNVYPNPVTSSSMFAIEMDSESDISIEIVSATGQTVTSVSRHLKGGKSIIPLPAGNLSSGLYFFRVSSGTKHSTGKLLVN